MRKINKEVWKKILRKTPWGHSTSPREEGLNTEEIKGLFYRAITDEEDSVIAEINRIVEEGNKQFSEIDNSEYFGKLENDPIFASRQSWIRNGNLVYVYGRLINITSISDDAFGNITNVGYGKNLFLRLTAPEGVIPDKSLTLTIGESVFNGLTLLNNTREEAMKGIYYIRFSVRTNNERKQTVSIKWNEEENTETVVFDFNDDYAETMTKKLFIKFSASADGSDASEEWSEGLDYIGFYFGREDVDPSEYKWAKFVGESKSQSGLVGPATYLKSYKVLVGEWENNEARVILDFIKETSTVFALPLYTAYDYWYENKIRVDQVTNGKVTLRCDKSPGTSTEFVLYVANRAE